MILSKKSSKDSTLLDAGAKIINAKSIIILAHYRPDGDAIGSCLALASSLRAMGKAVTTVNQDDTPEYLKFLESDENQVVQVNSPLHADLIIALDCATIERLGVETLALLEAPSVLTIDHHITNEQYGDDLILDTKAAATGEILYNLIKENNFPLPNDARDALYVAISTDTGSLQYSNASPETYQTMASLVAAGVDVASINAMTYFNHSVRKVEILRECLQNFQLAHQGQVSYWTVSHEAQAKVGTQRGDMEGLMDILRGIAGVRACFTLEEDASGEIRLSMRSKDEALDVSQVCAQFGGGGHRMAAGAAIHGEKLDSCAQQVLAILANAL